MAKKLGKGYLRYFFAVILLAFALNGYSVTYYVSSEGNDSNSGTSPDHPWKSLEKVNSFKPAPGDQILFKRGEEWNGTINVSASGTAGNPIVYGAYGAGENPKIYGSTEIKGWKLHKGNIYKATVDFNIEQLFINNKRAKLARYPNSGYFKITGVNSSTQFTSKDLDSGINYKGATWVGRTSAFTIFSKPVTSSNSQTLTLKSIPTYRLNVDEGFFLADKLEFLDEAGEWYYDTPTGTVYFWPPNGNSPDNYPARGSTSEYGIHISDKNYIEIKNFDILHSSNTGVYINKTNNITIDNNRIFSPDLVGIHIPAGESNAVKLKNNHIYQANGSGIRCYSSSTTITDNIIENTGLLENINKSTFKHDNLGTGVFLRGNNINFTYNRIINSGYCGVNFKGKNTMIKYNFIDGACQVLDDGGGIYTYNKKNPGGSSGSEIMHNIVLNVHGNRLGYTNEYDAGYGIYMDNETTDILIKHNTVSNVSCGLYIHDAGNITMQKNTIFDALLGCRASGEYSSNYIIDNLFYGIERNGDFTWWTNQHQIFQVRDASAPVYKNNRYINPYNTMAFRAGTFLSFISWKSTTSQDLNSIFDSSPLAEGESEKLIYNDTKQTKTFNLGNSVFRDTDGNKVSENLDLEPFTSKILIGTNFDVFNE